ncbi:MAG: 4Fe-4S binding protein [Deltaproteobacteria bacterium]|nr:4Fe-4S binding protein [Deltaproteobacteria bacterium]
MGFCDGFSFRVSKIFDSVIYFLGCGRCLEACPTDAMDYGLKIK